MLCCFVTPVSRARNAVVALVHDMLASTDRGIAEVVGAEKAVIAEIVRRCVGAFREFHVAAIDRARDIVIAVVIFGEMNADRIRAILRNAEISSARNFFEILVAINNSVSATSVVIAEIVRASVAIITERVRGVANTLAGTLIAYIERALMSIRAKRVVWCVLAAQSGVASVDRACNVIVAVDRGLETAFIFVTPVRVANVISVNTGRIVGEVKATSQTVRTRVLSAIEAVIARKIFMRANSVA